MLDKGNKIAAGLHQRPLLHFYLYEGHHVVSEGLCSLSCCSRLWVGICFKVGPYPPPLLRSQDSCFTPAGGSVTYMPVSERPTLEQSIRTSRGFKSWRMMYLFRQSHPWQHLSISCNSSGGTAGTSGDTDTPRVPLTLKRLFSFATSTPCWAFLLNIRLATYSCWRFSFRSSLLVERSVNHTTQIQNVQ